MMVSMNRPTPRGDRMTTAPLHTCYQGPICGEWPQEDLDDMRMGCDHESCLRVVNDWGSCQACWVTVSAELDEADFQLEREAMRRELTALRGRPITDDELDAAIRADQELF